MPQNLTIIGLGLLGGSIGLAVKDRIRGCKIMGCAHREGSLKDALALGAIDSWTLDPAEAVREADFVVLCMPVSMIGTWIWKIAGHLKAGAVVTDVGSTKAAICYAGEAIQRPAHFVGSHPMAGSEKKGVAVARADLFDGATCIVTPTSGTDSGAADTVAAFWQTLGCRVVRHDPETHDRLVSLVSHLPHAVAAAVVAVQSDASLDLRGKGFLDSTRVAAGDAELWRDIFTDNRDNVVIAIDRLIAELATLSRTLRSNDPAALQQWLAQAARVRTSLDPRNADRQ